MLMSGMTGEVASGSLRRPRCPLPVRAARPLSVRRLQLRANAVSSRANLSPPPLCAHPLAARRGFCAASHARATKQPTLHASTSEASASAGEASPGGVAELERRINEAVVGSSVQILDAVYADPSLSVSYARFYTLETIARVPYFAFLSVLHLYETLGWWRRSDYLKIHFAESWNELHHLRIAEELGGADRFADRFLAQHLAVAYYWVTVSLYLLSPRMAYNLMEQIEEHAFHTYDSFVQRCGAELATLPVPAVAREYYETNEANQWLFDEFQTASNEKRRPKLASLRDVFEAIRDDEGEHAATMRLCQSSGKLRSPHDTTGAALDPTCGGVIECAIVAPTGWRAEEEAARKAAQ